MNRAKKPQTVDLLRCAREKMEKESNRHPRVADDGLVDSQTVVRGLVDRHPRPTRNGGRTGGARRDRG